MFGYHQKLLRVDLSHRRIEVEDLAEGLIRKYNVTNHVDWLNLITDWGMDIPEYMKVGERIFNLKRMYNVRLGVSRKDDFLPYRFLTLKRTGEDLTNQLPPIGRLLSDYYAYRRWNEEGIPTPEKLEELGLDEL